MEFDLRDPTTRRMMVFSGLLFILFIAAWEWLPGLMKIPPFIIPPASRTWHEFVRMLGHEHLLYHSAITAMQVVVGFVLGMLISQAGSNDRRWY